MVCSRYSAVGNMGDCHSEGPRFEPVSGTFAFVDFVDIKISYQQQAACFSRALLATLSRFMFLCVWV